MRANRDCCMCFVVRGSWWWLTGWKWCWAQCRSWYAGSWEQRMDDCRCSFDLFLAWEDILWGTCYWCWWCCWKSPLSVSSYCYYCGGSSSSVSSLTLQPGLIRKYDTIDKEGKVLKGFTTTQLYMPVPGEHWLYRIQIYITSSSSFTLLSLLPSCHSLKFAHPINIEESKVFQMVLHWTPNTLHNWAN